MKRLAHFHLLIGQSFTRKCPHGHVIIAGRTILHDKLKAACNLSWLSSEPAISVRPNGYHARGPRTVDESGAVPHLKPLQRVIQRRHIDTRMLISRPGAPEANVLGRGSVDGRDAHSNQAGTPARRVAEFGAVCGCLTPSSRGWTTWPLGPMARWAARETSRKRSSPGPIKYLRCGSGALRRASLEWSHKKPGPRCGPVRTWGEAPARRSRPGEREGIRGSFFRKERPRR